MKTLSFLLISIALLLLNTSCREVFEVDISNSTPVVILPSNNDTSAVNPVQFKWEELDGATKYHLEIVNPSFSAISNFTLDTIVTGTVFFQLLDSNEYELKLTAMNAGYTSKTIGPIKFWVGVQPPVQVNSVTIVSPSQNTYVNTSFNGPFTWNSITNTTSFEFSLRQGAIFETGSIVDFQNNITPALNTNSINLTNGIVLSEGQYVWGVKAYFTNSNESPFSTRTFYVDGTNPNQPIGPFSPILAMTAGNITFQWENGSDNGTIQSPVHSTLEIASNSSFSNLWNTSPIEVVDNQVMVDMTLAAAGIYYWRVRNWDEALNYSTYSITNSFSIN